MAVRVHVYLNMRVTWSTMRPKRGGGRGAAGMRGVMACYRGCIKAVYVREMDAGVTFNPPRMPLTLNTVTK